MAKKNENLYVVEVGTDPETARAGFAQDAGSDYFGPFTHDSAVAFADKINFLWAEVDREHFVYGRPFTKITAIQQVNESNAGNAAKNWYRDPDDWSDED